MTSGTLPAGQRIFYGWFVVAAAFTVTFAGFGCAYSFSAFIEPLQTDFNASRGSVSLVFSLAGFLYFGLGVITGPLADRWGARTLAVTGMILTGAGLALASMARSLVEVYAAYGLGVGLGVGCSYVPAIAAVQRWFLKRRGFASGLAVSGIGAGTLLMPPAAAALIAAFGWRTAYLALALFASLAGGGMALLIESDPAVRGLGPDGGTLRSPGEPGAAHEAGASAGEALKTRQFAILYGSSLVCSFGLFVPFVHLVPYAVDHGIEQSQAILLMGMIGVGSTAGRFFIGDLADRAGRGRALFVMFLGMGLSLLAWAFCVSFASLVIFALAFGAFYGGWVAIAPALVMDYFGGRNVSTIIGMLYTSVALGALIGPSAAGFAFDITHSYTLPILASAGASFFAAALAARLPSVSRP